MPRQIAAVDGRNVSRLERSKIARVVPVVEMPAHALHATHRRKRRLQPLNRLARSDPTEIARANDGKKIEADIGRRGPMRDRRRRIVLKIVWRQHVVGRRDESLEEPPRAARGQPQRLRIGLVDIGQVAAAPGDRLTKRATAGEATQSAAKGNASGQVPWRDDKATIAAAPPTPSRPPFGARSPANRGAGRSSPARREPIRADAVGLRRGARACGRSHRPSATPDPPGTSPSAPKGSRQGGNRRRARANGFETLRRLDAAEWRRRPE